MMSFGFFSFYDSSRIAQLRTLHAEVANNHMVKIRMLEYDIKGTGLNTLSAVGAFFLVNDKCTDLILTDRSFRACFLAFCTLSTDKWPVSAGNRKFRFNP